MQSPKLVPGQNCRGPHSSTVQGLHLCVPFWCLCVPLWLGIYAAWTGRQLLVRVSPHQWEWSWSNSNNGLRLETGDGWRTSNCGALGGFFFRRIIPCLLPAAPQCCTQDRPCAVREGCWQLAPCHPRLVLVYWLLRSLLPWLPFGDCFLRGTAFLALLLCSLSLVIWGTLLQSFGVSCYTLHIIGLCVWAAVKCSDCLKTL